jgi:hypothetical protein
MSGSPTTPPAPLHPKRKRHLLLWILLVLFLAGVLWSMLSSNPFAQGLREMGGDKHDQTIIEKTFSVSPRGFRYYKFTLPDGSTNVALVGQFASSSERNQAGVPGNEAGNQAQAAGNGIELYVLTEAAFAIWQKGYSTNSLYDSQPVAEAKVHLDLPPGPGVYYLVFSNKFSPKIAKNVTASLLLHYKSWIPEWIRHMNASLWTVLNPTILQARIP